MKVTGKVVKGKGEGKGLGFPTANLKATQKFDLADGVYLAEVDRQGKKYQSIVIKGVTNDLEVWLKDCDEDLYDQELSVKVGEKISELQSFTNKVDLIKKIKEDIRKAEEFFKKRG